MKATPNITSHLLIVIAAWLAIVLQASTKATSLARFSTKAIDYTIANREHFKPNIDIDLPLFVLKSSS